MFVRRSSVRLIVLLLIAVVATGFGLSAQEPPAAEGELVNRVVLRVNDRIATLYDYERQLAQARAEITSRTDLPPERQRELLEQAPREVMRSIFDELLILSRADQLALSVSELDVDGEIQAQMEQFGLRDEKELAAALAQNGLSMPQYRQNLRRQILWRRVFQQELYPRIEVPEGRLRELYREQIDQYGVPEQRKLREIVVLDTSELSVDQRRLLAEELQQAWSEGRAPQELVDEVVAEHGEEVAALLDVGWVSPGDLSPELEKTVWALAPGDVSEPVEARGGLHLAQVLELREATVRPFEEVRGDLLSQERARRFGEEQTKYLEELEQRAFYEYRPIPGLGDFRTASGRVVREGQRDLLAKPQSAAETELGEGVNQ